MVQRKTKMTAITPKDITQALQSNTWGLTGSGGTHHTPHAHHLAFKAHYEPATQSIPEPGTLIMLLGVIALAGLRRLKKR